METVYLGEGDGPDGVPGRVPCVGGVGRGCMVTGVDSGDRGRWWRRGRKWAFTGHSSQI